jgi:hypothetical protein
MYNDESENHEINLFEARLASMRFQADPYYQEKLKQNLLQKVNAPSKRGSGGWWSRMSNFERFRFFASGVAVAAIMLFFGAYFMLGLTANLAVEPTPTIIAGTKINEYFDPVSQQNISAENAFAALGFEPRLPEKLPPEFKVTYAGLPEAGGMMQRGKPQRSLQVSFGYVDAKKAVELKASGGRFELYQFRWNSEDGILQVQGTNRARAQTVGKDQGWLIEGGGWFAFSSNFGNVPPGIINLESMPPDRKPPVVRMRENVGVERPAVVFGNIAVDAPRKEVRASFVNATPSLRPEAKTLLWQKDGVFYALVNDSGLSVAEMVQVAESVK